MRKHSPDAEIQGLRTDSLARVRSYVEKNVLPSFDAPGPFTLNPALFGVKSLVYYLDILHVSPLVLRAEPSRRKLAHRITGHEILFRLQLPVPEVLYRDLRFRTRFLYGFYFMAEQKLEGTPFQEYQDPKDKAARLGETFARLHRNTAQGKGNLGNISWYHWNNVILLRKRAKKWLTRYRDADCPNAEQIKAWLDRRPKDAWTPTPRLCIGDIASTNILIHGEEVHLVDLSSVKLSSALMEMVRIRSKVLLDRDDAWKAFLEGYIEASDPNQRREIDCFLPLLEALQRIRLAGKSSNPNQRAYHCQRLFEILELGP